MNYLCIHAHFYQPPRENPWLEQIELQDSAISLSRLERAHLPPNATRPTWPRAFWTTSNHITQIVNNYSRISFNFGPTLLSWAADHAPDTYKGIIDADKHSQKNFPGTVRPWRKPTTT